MALVSLASSSLKAAIAADSAAAVSEKSAYNLPLNPLRRLFILSNKASSSYKSALPN